MTATNICSNFGGMWDGWRNMEECKEVLLQRELVTVMAEVGNVLCIA